MNSPVHRDMASSGWSQRQTGSCYLARLNSEVPASLALRSQVNSSLGRFTTGDLDPADPQLTELDQV